MARSLFVQPKTVRIELSDGYWIKVKERLSVGEIRKAGQDAAGVMTADGGFRPNIEMAGLAQILAYLVDWNFDNNGQVVEIAGNDAAKLAAVRQLDISIFQELDEAIGKHIERVVAETEAEKKTSGGVTNSEATLV